MSERIENLTPFFVMEILELAKTLEKKGKKIIHLEIGEPDFETPAIIKDAAIKALENGETFYTHSMGMLGLREKIVDYYKNSGVIIDKERILVTSGTSPGMLIIFLALIDIGEEVIVVEPSYPCYKNFIKIVSGKEISVQASDKTGFIPDIKELKKAISPKTKAIIINSPSNPTGAVYPEKILQEISKLGITIVSDEIYHGLVYQGKEHSILEYTDNAFVINGFSKAYAMTGFRLGYVIFPEQFKRTIQNIHQNFFISANSFVQYAGITALDNGEKEKEKMRKIFSKRREKLLKELNKYNLAPAVSPKGAFYTMVNLSEMVKDSLQFAKDLLISKQVAVAPGIDFNAEGMIRLAYTVEEKFIEEGVKRLAEFLKEQYEYKY